MSAIINYFTSSYEELKKIIWPSRAEVTSHTVIVIFSILISMGVIALLDKALYALVQIIIAP